MYPCKLYTHMDDGWPGLGGGGVLTKQGRGSTYQTGKVECNCSYQLVQLCYSHIAGVVILQLQSRQGHATAIGTHVILQLQGRQDPCYSHRRNHATAAGNAPLLFHFACGSSISAAQHQKK